MAAGPTILNVHTPTSSFAIVHSLTQESLTSLFEKLNQKLYADHHGLPVGPGWLKYEYNGTIWDLNDESDYVIFGWRQKEYQADSLSPVHIPMALPTVALGEAGPSKPALSYSAPQDELPPVIPATSTSPTPTLHLHNPTQPIPGIGEYHNSTFYIYRPLPVPARQIQPRSAPPSAGRPSSHTHGGRKKANNGEADGKRLMKEFEKFHNENGVRTVMGSIGPVKNVRMLLKAGYRHVYISRRFAHKHGFIPADAIPGNYGYGGLVNIGAWPVTLVTAPVATASQDDSTSTTNTHSRISHPTMHVVEADGSIHEDGPIGTDHNARTMSDGFEGRSLLRTPKTAGAIESGLVGSAGRKHGGGRSAGNLSAAASRASNALRATSTSPQPHHHGGRRHGHDSFPEARNAGTGTADDMLARKSLFNGSTGHYARTTEALQLPSHSQDKYNQTRPHDKSEKGDQKKPTVTYIQVYLSEEPHFDVVLGRSFFEKRQIKTSATDPTDVICLDTGERIECELVILKDGKGEIVTVT